MKSVRRTSFHMCLGTAFHTLCILYGYRAELSVTLRRLETVDLAKGDLLVMRYKTIATLVREKWVQLI